MVSFKRLENYSTGHFEEPNRVEPPRPPLEFRRNSEDLVPEISFQEISRGKGRGSLPNRNPNIHSSRSCTQGRDSSLGLKPGDFCEGLKRCIQRLERLNLDSLLISDPVNIKYLCGFREAEGYLLVTEDGQTLYFTNFLYEAEAKKANFAKIIISNGSYFKLIKEVVRRLHLKKVGFEGKQLPFLEYKKIEEALGEIKVDFIRTIDFMQSLRAQKTKKELSLIKKAIAISKEAFQYIKEIYDEAMTEKTLSIEIEKFLKLKGDNSIAFPPIVASGKNSAFPHHLAKSTKINNSLCLIDLGAQYCGYCADLTRVIFASIMPLRLKRVYDIVRKAQEKAIKKIKDGIAAKEVDRAARAFLEQKGVGKFFGHGLGHGIGLSVHESPFINPKNEQVLKEGMVITIEPAVYLEGKFGIRLEDMVLVKKENAEVLSGHIHL